MSIKPSQKGIDSETTTFLRPKIWLSWSSGKDSYAALQHLWAEDRYQVVSIFTVVDSAKNQILMHAVSVELLRRQADALGLQYHLSKFDDNDPDSGIQTLLNKARQSDIRLFAFGDLFLEDIRQYREQNMANTGIGTLFPLWQQPTHKLIVGLINSGMRAIITSVDLTALPASFLGRELTIEVVEQIIALGGDPCGENGEYHSFVFDGPLFHYPVDFEKEDPVIEGDFGHLRLKPATNKPHILSRSYSLANDGFAVLEPARQQLTPVLHEISNDILQLANEIFTEQRDDRRFSNLAALREGLATELDPVCLLIIDHILQTAHEIDQINETILPILAQLAQNLGYPANPDRAIARFRVATPSRSSHDHLWHQDSVAPPGTMKSQRTSQLGVWIPLHDVGIDEGTMQFARGSHSQPIPHPNKDAQERLCFPEKYVQSYEKTKVPVSFGDALIFDAWVAHRTVPNTSDRIRLALLVWF